MMLLTLPAHTALITEEPGPCTACRTMTVFFINRAGRVVCTSCDTKQEAQYGD